MAETPVELYGAVEVQAEAHASLDLDHCLLVLEEEEVY